MIYYKLSFIYYKLERENNEKKIGFNPSGAGVF